MRLDPSYPDLDNNFKFESNRALTLRSMPTFLLKTKNYSKT